MTLEVGAPAPDFTLRNQHGEDVILSSFRGHRALVVVFYPYAFSRICTGELGELQDAAPEFQNDDVQLLAVSCDPMFTLRAFADHDGLTYPLLSDFWPHGAAARAYGVFDEGQGCALRGTFVVDAEGVLRWKIEHGMGEARQVDDYRKALADLPG